MSSSSIENHTRRDFVKASAVAAMSAPLVAAAAAERPASKAPMREIETDVLVCGGGCAGTAAALSAARNGARTLLVEKAPFAGGIITSVGLPYLNLLVAGRCHSATRGAHASTRLTVTAMALGEAAGCAAAMSLKEKTAVAMLNGQRVRETLSKQNAGPFTEA